MLPWAPIRQRLPPAIFRPRNLRKLRAHLVAMNLSARRWITLLLFLQIRYLPVLARFCTCSTKEHGGCNHGVCIAPQSSTQFACEMSVRLAPNGTVTEVKYYCLAGLIPPCGGPPDIDLSGFSTYYACCGNADECNRCLVPTALPDEAKLQLDVSRDCNHSLLNKQPTQTMSPSLKSTDPSSSEENAPVHPYLRAALAVGCATIVCLVAVPLTVLTVWFRRKYLLSRATNLV
ncbi:hypothetical protein GBAR_LOCUS22699 [Geodia barretti]|uniref:Uncharacterized protein n=1 Tax=Geodia barretti TaxID=519541 RepID=A0AA35X0I7_GEOBA|nr:hypothetical protein GBAR_LOCUS22699 [Geodia barretti]